MEQMTLGQLLQAVNGEILGEFGDLNTVITQIKTDSRSIEAGDLFIPLTGERFDGHAYLDAALTGGAIGCLTAHERSDYRSDKFYVKVADTELALRDLAVWYKNQFDIPFIGVTGSVGKTTAKDMIAAVLGVKYRVLKTEGNFNNNIGLPLTLLRLTHEHEACVLEMGMDKFGEIDYLAQAVKPTIGVITNIGDAHIERLGSRENIFKAKCELLPHIQKDGLLILNGDDSFLSELRGKTDIHTVFCGEGAELEYSAQPVGGDGMSNIVLHMKTPKLDCDMRIPALGEHMIYPALIAAAVAEYLGMTGDEIEEGFAQFVPTRMRMNVIRRAEQITILDDTYNANPQSMRAAISVLADGPRTRKIAVLGDMLELGPFAPALHTGVGEYLGKAGVGCVIAVGEMAKYIAEGAKNTGVPEIYSCEDKYEAKKILEQVIRPDSAILFKASRGMKLEELTEYTLKLTQEE